MPSKESCGPRAVLGSMARGQSRRATSHTVTAEPWGSECSATKIGSHSTCGLLWASWLSSARLMPNAAAAPATKAEANTVMVEGRWRLAAVPPVGAEAGDTEDGMG